MRFSRVLRAFINQAREEIEPNRNWDRDYPYELAMLRRLVPAIDSRSDEQLLRTVLEMKAVLDARTEPVFTILPAVVDMLADELQGRQSHSTIPCPRCGAGISILQTDIRFAARYSCPECSNDIVLPADQVGEA